MRTEVIAASAGTGKTFRIAEELKRELLDPLSATAPERVVAVTFTRAAAAELSARVRRALIDAGHPSLARRLGAARIGTIHSVCARLVREHAFALGLSPELHTLDEHLAEHAIKDALEQQVAEDQRTVLDDLDERLGGFSWQQAVKDIIDNARLNGLDAGTLAMSTERSVGDLLAAMPLPVDDGAVIEGELLTLIDKVLAGPEPGFDDAREEWGRLHEIRRSLRRGDPVPWASWLALGDSHMTVLRRFGVEHVRHPRLRADLEAAIRTVFHVASLALERYDADKRAWGVFDFVDQETFALRLLKNPQVRPLLQEEIGLVLVDEFQDTSPLQLAILSEISALADKTVFVGDQKQAIYGFRGTDPALMEAVVDKLATTNSAPLNISYRSRPGLVALTSSLFAPAFAAQGVPEERVRVKASLVDEPAGLGPFIERWRLRDGRSGAEIAAGVAELLEDPTVRVRERGAVVAVRPRHIAVLARTNRHARDVAASLADAGIAAVLRRRGLASTIEARALAAGLALFHDGRDALAAAELTRVTRGAADASGWLTMLVDAAADAADANMNASASAVAAPGTVAPAARVYARPFNEDAYVAAVADVARVNRQAGVVLAVDLVVEALRLRDCCSAWGDTGQRLANLGALRALAVRFVEERAATGAGATIVGFLARLDELTELNEYSDESDDEQGDVSGQDAVEVSTWHKSKGREWPIVVLAQLVYQRPPRIWGVHVASDALFVDVTKPLEGRWVRYWPSPYGDWPNEGGLIDLLDSHPVKRALDDAARKEELRLLYVGWTRARDRVVLPGPHGDDIGARLDLWSGERSLLRLLADKGRPLLAEPVTSSAPSPAQGREAADESAESGRDGDPHPGDSVYARAHWADLAVDIVIRKPGTRAHKPPLEGARPVTAPLPSTTYAPAFLAPSSVEATGEASEPISLGSPIMLHEFADFETMALLGTALHAFFAADRRDDDNARFRLAQRLLDAYTVPHLLAPGDVVTIADRLWTALFKRYGAARVVREAYVAQRLPLGTVVRGQMDLVLETEAGFVIVDHKTYVVDDARSLAASFAGQLRAYASALSAATQRPVTETWVHLPLSAALVLVR